MQLNKLYLITRFSFAMHAITNQPSSNTVLERDQGKPITVFIHGTLFSAFSWLVNLIDCPRGFYPSTQLQRKLVISQVPSILHEADPEQFPIDTFYLFGWTGYLSFGVRKEAALQLYHALKNHTGSITLIGQSHGCNVALNLAQIADEMGDTEFTVDRLILLAGPVQAYNAAYIQSPIFKKVYSLYSTADLIQILDPQGLYQETKELAKQTHTKTPFFSRRTFASAPNLIQARIIINKRSPSHIDFMLTKVLRHLPKILELLDTESESEIRDSGDKHYCVNITYKKRRGITEYSVRSLS